MKCLNGINKDQITFDNFHLSTFANFEKVPLKNIPKTKPAFVSKSGSKYWYIDEYVYRYSNHFSRSINTCKWFLNGKSQKTGLGRCKLSNFKRINREMTIGEKYNIFYAPKNKQGIEILYSIFNTFLGGTDSFYVLENTRISKSSFCTAIPQFVINKNNSTLLKGLNKMGYNPPHTKEKHSPAFWKWFGNSKVVDENGDPLVVYRGQREDLGNEFRYGVKLMSAKDKPNNFGFFFTDRTKTANGYAGNDYAKGGNITPVYLKCENPLDMRDLPLYPTTKMFNDYFLNLGIKLPEFSAQLLRHESLPVFMFFDEYGELLRKELQKVGYDGVIFDDTTAIGNTYVVFSPNQIKSATGNDGTYDIDDDSILSGDSDITCSDDCLAKGIIYIKSLSPVSDMMIKYAYEKKYLDFKKLNDFGKELLSVNKNLKLEEIENEVRDIIYRYSNSERKRDILIYRLADQTTSKYSKYLQIIHKLLFPDNDKITNIPGINTKFTPAFWKWFGNSKVVDENGNPLVVYHGTLNNFDIFKRGDLGFHFGTEKQALSRIRTLINQKFKYEGIDKKELKKKVKILKVYLSAQKLLETKDYGNWHNPIDIAKGMLKEGHISQNDFNSLNFDRIFLLNKENYKVLKEFLIKKGYDGIKYLNKYEYQSKPAYSYIVFSPSQIKSATGNDGTFDIDDDSILSGTNNNYIDEDKVYDSYNQKSTNELEIKLKELKNTNNYPNDTIKILFKKLEEIIERILEERKYEKIFTQDEDVELIDETNLPVFVEFNKAFYDWFKNSKVVDKNGNPLVVYHFTKVNFDKFDKEFIGTTNHSTILNGFYFADVPFPITRGGKNIKVYLSIKNPIIINVRKSNWDSIGVQEIISGFLISGMFEDELLEYLTDVENYDIKKAKNILKKWLKADGAILKNVNYDIHNTEYVVFNPNQIKSATGNDGTYDIDDNSILSGAGTGKMPEDYEMVYGGYKIWEQNDYYITVSGNDWRSVNLWWLNRKGEPIKIGFIMFYFPNRVGGEFKEYLEVRNAEIDKKHRGLGLGLVLYQIALKYLPIKFKGIISYLPDRYNKKQIPKIYKKLGGESFEDIAWIDKQNSNNLSGLSLVLENDIERYLFNDLIKSVNNDGTYDIDDDSILSDKINHGELDRAFNHLKTVYPIFADTVRYVVNRGAVSPDNYDNLARALLNFKSPEWNDLLKLLVSFYTNQARLESVYNKLPENILEKYPKYIKIIKNLLGL